MPSFGEDFFGQGVANPYVHLRDYRHASRMYVDNYYRLLPKFKNLYSVLVRPNPDVMNAIRTTLSKPESNPSMGSLAKIFDTVSDVLDMPNRLMNNILGDPSEGSRVRELSALAHRVDLPKFTLMSQDINQYNKRVNIYTGIKYDPVQITFYDDNNNTVINLWNNIYKYFFGDGNVPRKSGFFPDVVKPVRNNNNWGFQARTFKNFFLAIDFYSFNRGQFTMHSIQNPWIISMQSGEHEYSGSTELRDMTMQFGYSGVLYASGYIKKGTPPGFADLIYDTTPSPLTNTSPGDIYKQLGDLASATGGLFEGGTTAQQLISSIKNITGGGQITVPNTRPVTTNTVAGSYNTGNPQAQKTTQPTTTTVSTGGLPAAGTAPGSNPVPTNK